jgi:CheY-like chemotaxis protein
MGSKRRGWDDFVISECKEMGGLGLETASFDQPIKILLVDDDEEDYLITRDLLDEIRDKKFDLEWVDNYDEGLEQFSRQQHDVYLLDYRLGARSGLDLLSEARELACGAPIIILTGQGDVEVDPIWSRWDWIPKGWIVPYAILCSRRG